MRVHFRSKDTRFASWLQRHLEPLRLALASLQRLLALDRQPAALVLTPIRAQHPHVARQRHRRTWRE